MKRFVILFAVVVLLAGCGGAGSGSSVDITIESYPPSGSAYTGDNPATVVVSLNGSPSKTYIISWDANDFSNGNYDGMVGTTFAGFAEPGNVQSLSLPAYPGDNAEDPITGSGSSWTVWVIDWDDLSIAATKDFSTSLTWN